jgi:hypothetical protein
MKKPPLDLALINREVSDALFHAQKCRDFSDMFRKDGNTYQATLFRAKSENHVDYAYHLKTLLAKQMKGAETQCNIPE